MISLWKIVDGTNCSQTCGSNNFQLCFCPVPQPNHSIEEQSLKHSYNKIYYEATTHDNNAATLLDMHDLKQLWLETMKPNLYLIFELSILNQRSPLDNEILFCDGTTVVVVVIVLVHNEVVVENSINAAYVLLPLLSVSNLSEV